MPRGGVLRAGVNQSLIGQKFKIADEIPPSDWSISNWSVIGQ